MATKQQTAFYVLENDKYLTMCGQMTAASMSINVESRVPRGSHIEHLSFTTKICRTFICFHAVFIILCVLLCEMKFCKTR